MTSTTTAAATAATAASQPIEHIVLFKVKAETDPAKVNAMIDSLDSLISLNIMESRTMGPIHHIKSSPIPFTHMAHSRFSSKETLGAWSTHPSHLTVIRDQILPICDDVVIVDWVADYLNGPLALSPGSVARVALMKLKEDSGAEVKDEVLGVIRGINERFGRTINQISCGENITPASAKGYSVVSVAVFGGGVSEVEAADSNDELQSFEGEKLRDYLESTIVVDYVVPS